MILIQKDKTMRLIKIKSENFYVVTRYSTNLGWGFLYNVTDKAIENVLYKKDLADGEYHLITHCSIDLAMHCGHHRCDNSIVIRHLAQKDIDSILLAGSFEYKIVKAIKYWGKFPGEKQKGIAYGLGLAKELFKSSLENFNEYTEDQLLKLLDVYEDSAINPTQKKPYWEQAEEIIGEKTEYTVKFVGHRLKLAN